MDEEWGEGEKEGEREKLRKFVLHDSLSLSLSLPYPHMRTYGGGNEEIFSRALPPPPPPTLPKRNKKSLIASQSARGDASRLTPCRKEVLSRTAILSTTPHAGRLVGLFLHFFVLPPTSNCP